MVSSVKDVCKSRGRFKCRQPVDVGEGIENLADVQKFVFF